MFYGQSRTKRWLGWDGATKAFFWYDTNEILPDMDNLDYIHNIGFASVFSGEISMKYRKGSL